MMHPIRVAWLILFAFVPAGVIVATTGCKKPSETVPGQTQSDKVKVAERAGEAAALLYILVDKPSHEKALAIKEVTDLIAAQLKDYRQGGFITALPEINALIDQKLPPDTKPTENFGAKKLAQTLLEELDNLFAKHPEWKTESKAVAGIIGGFAKGASSELEDYAIADKKLRK